MRELDKGKILHNLVYLSVPIFVTNMMQNFFSIFDMFLLGKMGVAAQSAISITGFIFSIFWAITGGMMAGASAITSRYAGRKDYEKLNNAVVNIIFAGYIMAFIYVAVNLIFMDQMLSFFGAKGETMVLSKLVFRLSLVTFLNDSGLFMFFAILRGTGNIKKHFYLLFTSIGLNIILEPIFIYGWLGFPKMGIQGVPMARLVSYFVTTFIMIHILTQDNGVLKVNFKHIKIDLGIIFKFMKISLPASFQGVLANLAGLVLLKIAAPYGDGMMAALGIGSRLDVFVMNIGWAIGSSVSVLVGHNMGAGKIERAEESFNNGLHIFSYFTFACFMVYFFLSDWVIKFFNTDPSVVLYGTSYLRIVSPFYLLMGVGLISSFVFNGAGSTKTPMVINAIAYFALQIPIALFLSRLPMVQFRSIFIGIASVYFFQGVAGYFMYRKGRWKRKQI
jgi:putative MATE family efflux protein